MRIVYGATGAALVCVITVGLVQPDFGATSTTPVDEATAQSSVGLDSVAVSERSRRTQPNVEVRHVVRYIKLKPGQTAPPGATVIAAKQRRPSATTATQPVPANQADTPKQEPTATQRPAPQPPAPKPTAQPQPPKPKPTVTTRQSGRP
jgi:hypothetical protein